MNIYNYAKSINYGADYYEQRTGYIYHIEEYGKAKSSGLLIPGIRISENGKTIGYAKEM